MNTSETVPFDQLVQAPIFVIGAARSGTTWVYEILTSHPQVAGVYESWLFTENKGIKTLFGEAHRPGSGLGNLLSNDHLVAHAREFAIQVLSHGIEPEHRFLVEKSPSHAFSIEFILRMFPLARFIHVLRDGRDVGVSVRAASNSWSPEWATKHHGKSIGHSAKAWRDLVRAVHRDRKMLGDRFLEVRYESLRTEPLENYRILFDFCGIPHDDALLRRIYGTTDFETNYQASETSFRRGGRIGDWCTAFSLWDAWRFHRRAGELLVDLGYAQPLWWLPGFRRSKNRGGNCDPH